MVAVRFAGWCHPGATCFDDGNTTAYGYGDAERKFQFWTAEALGANPEGTMSANPLSLRTWTSAGFIAIYQPFFSETLLPDQVHRPAGRAPCRVADSRAPPPHLRLRPESTSRWPTIG